MICSRSLIDRGQELSVLQAAAGHPTLSSLLGRLRRGNQQPPG